MSNKLPSLPSQLSFSSLLLKKEVEEEAVVVKIIFKKVVTFGKWKTSVWDLGWHDLDEIGAPDSKGTRFRNGNRSICDPWQSNQTK